MKVGDRAFFYHSSCKVPGIVGVVKVRRRGCSARGGSAGFVVVVGGRGLSQRGASLRANCEPGAGEGCPQLDLPLASLSISHRSRDQRGPSLTPTTHHHRNAIHSPAARRTAIEPRQVVREAYPDHTQFDESSDYYDPKSSDEKVKWHMVDIQLERRLGR